MKLSQCHVGRMVMRTDRCDNGTCYKDIYQIDSVYVHNNEPFVVIVPLDIGVSNNVPHFHPDDIEPIEDFGY